MDPARYTEMVKAALATAQSYALERAHQELRAEHQLLALLDQPDGLSPRLLERVGTDPATVRARLAESLDSSPSVSGPGAGDLRLSGALARTLAHADAQARKLGDDYVSSEHLLLAFVEADSDGAAGKALRDAGVTRDALLRELNYVATVVRDVEEATTLYQEVLGLEVTSPRNTEAGLNFERVVMGVGGRGLLELMQPNDPTSTMGRYLDRQGEGPYMASFLVDDPAAAAEQVNARGGSATPDERYGAFVHPRTNHGLLVQLAGNYLTGSTG